MQAWVYLCWQQGRPVIRRSNWELVTMESPERHYGSKVLRSQCQAHRSVESWVLWFAHCLVLSEAPLRKHCCPVWARGDSCFSGANTPSDWQSFASSSTEGRIEPNAISILARRVFKTKEIASSLASIF